MEKEECFFALKVASSLDGISALSSGESQWITEEVSREQGFFLRLQYESVLIGLSSFLEDNPRLNPRLKDFENRKNKVLILDPYGKSLKLIENSRLRTCREKKDIFVIVGEKFKGSSDFPLIKVPFKNEEELDLKVLSERLYEAGVHSCLVEGGGKTLSSFLSQDQARRLYCFLNPSLIGGKRGKYWTEGHLTTTLSKKNTLKSIDFLRLGKDFLITGKL